MADIEDIAQIISVVSAAYPNFAPTEATAEVYYQTLRDIPADLLKAATLQAISEPGRKFAPSVGEIRGMVLEINKMAHGFPTSYEAWSEVRQQMIAVGTYSKPTFTHQIVADTVKAIGWQSLCLSDNEVAVRAHFIKAYEQLANRAELDAAMLPDVRGYIEDNRSSNDMKLLSEKLEVNNG